MANRMEEKISIKILVIDRVKSGEGQMCGKGNGGRKLCSVGNWGGI